MSISCDIYPWGQKEEAKTKYHWWLEVSQSRPWPQCGRIGPPNLGGRQIPDRNFFMVTISGVFQN